MGSFGYSVSLAGVLSFKFFSQVPPVWVELFISLVPNNNMYMYMYNNRNIRFPTYG